MEAWSSPTNGGMSPTDASNNRAAVWKFFKSNSKTTFFKPSTHVGLTIPTIGAPSPMKSEKILKSPCDGFVSPSAATTLPPLRSLGSPDLSDFTGGNNYSNRLAPLTNLKSLSMPNHVENSGTTPRMIYDPPTPPPSTSRRATQARRGGSPHLFMNEITPSNMRAQAFTSPNQLCNVNDILDEESHHQFVSGAGDMTSRSHPYATTHVSTTHNRSHNAAALLSVAASPLNHQDIMQMSPRAALHLASSHHHHNLMHQSNFQPSSSQPQSAGISQQGLTLSSFDEPSMMTSTSRIASSTAVNNINSGDGNGRSFSNNEDTSPTGSSSSVSSRTRQVIPMIHHFHHHHHSITNAYQQQQQSHQFSSTQQQQQCSDDTSPAAGRRRVPRRAAAMAVLKGSQQNGSATAVNYWQNTAILTDQTDAYYTNWADGSEFQSSRRNNRGLRTSTRNIRAGNITAVFDNSHLIPADATSHADSDMPRLFDEADVGLDLNGGDCINSPLPRRGGRKSESSVINPDLLIPKRLIAYRRGIHMRLGEVGRRTLKSLVQNKMHVDAELRNWVRTKYGRVKSLTVVQLLAVAHHANLWEAAVALGEQFASTKGADILIAGPGEGEDLYVLPTVASGHNNKGESNMDGANMNLEEMHDDAEEDDEEAGDVKSEEISLEIKAESGTEIKEKMPDPQLSISSSTPSVSEGKNLVVGQSAVLANNSSSIATVSFCGSPAANSSSMIVVAQPSPVILAEPSVSFLASAPQESKQQHSSGFPSKSPHPAPATSFTKSASSPILKRECGSAPNLDSILNINNNSSYVMQQVNAAAAAAASNLFITQPSSVNSSLPQPPSILTNSAAAAIFFSNNRIPSLSSSNPSLHSHAAVVANNNNFISSPNMTNMYGLHPGMMLMVPPENVHVSQQRTTTNSQQRVIPSNKIHTPVPQQHVSK